MQITIDTLKDSRDDIRKAIRLLMALAAESGDAPRNFFDNTPPAEPAAAPPVALGGFFDAIEQQPAAPAVAAKKDRPQVQLY